MVRSSTFERRCWRRRFHVYRTKRWHRLWPTAVRSTSWWRIIRRRLNVSRRMLRILRLIRLVRSRRIRGRRSVIIVVVFSSYPGDWTRYRWVIEAIPVDRVVRLSQCLVFFVVIVDNVVHHEEALGCEGPLRLKGMTSIWTNTPDCVAFSMHLSPIDEACLVDIDQGLGVIDAGPELDPVEVRK